ncbi:MAG: POTRA domain-containing protein [Terriglobia bacterium]
MTRIRIRLRWGGAEIVLLTGLLWLGRAAAGQSIPAISYDGQPVSAVDLIAAPGTNLTPLRRLVELRPHEPYSQAKAQASAAALRAAGRFTRVDLQITPEADGLRVSFLLQPVYYLGVITFPGAVYKFDYPQLLDVVNYPNEAPYDESRAQAANAALRGFFINDGYFLAQMSEHTGLDTSRKLANLVYDIDLGRRARFGTLEVTGPPPAEAKRIVGAVHSIRARVRGADIRAGKPYYPGHIQRASRRIQSYLGDHGWLANRIRLEKPHYDAETNRVPLHFEVELGPKVKIRVTGARIHKKTLKSLVPIYEEKSFDQELVEEGARNLVAYFQSKGYFDAAVQPKITKNLSEISLTYEVEHGNRHRVVSIRYLGNHHVDEDNLDPLVSVETAHLFSRGKFSQQLLSDSAKNLTTYYHNQGFETVRVAPKVTDVEPSLYITFQIAEGPQTIVNALNVVGIKTQSLAALSRGGLSLHAAQPFSPAAVAADRDRIVASYLNRGYPDVSFQATSSRTAKNRIDVTYTVREGPQANVRSVAVLGERHAKPAFVQRNAGIRAGAPLSQSAMLRAESALYGLGIFDWASVAPAHPVAEQNGTGAATAIADPPAGSKKTPAHSRDPAADVLIKVHESQRNSLTYGFGFLSTPRSGRISSGILALPGLPAIGLPSSFRVIEKNLISPEGSVAYSRKDILGRAETASVSALVSRLDQRLAFRYSDPQFHGPGWSSLATISAERTTQNPLFTARIGLGSLQFDHALNAAKTEHLQFRYSYSRTSLTNLLIQGFVPPGDQSVHSSTLSATFIRDTRDLPLDAHRGVFETLDLSLTPTVLGSSDNFARAFGQAAFYKQVKPWMVWANSVRLGVVQAFSGSHVPLSDRFFSGGADSLRGFPINGAGPQTTAFLCTRQNDPASCVEKVLVPTGGPQLFILNTEGRFPIPISFPSPIGKNLGGVIFYDGGNVYSRIGFSKFFSQYSNTVGLGLRYNTPVGPIRIDFGRNLNPPQGLKAFQVFVTLGQAF